MTTTAPELDRYADEALRANLNPAAGPYGCGTHPRQAVELLKLDTAARRRRAMGEAHTRVNLQGGILSGALFYVVRDLLAAIAAGREDEELEGERTAREYREREAALRAATGNPSAIYYPREFRNR